MAQIKSLDQIKVEVERSLDRLVVQRTQLDDQITALAKILKQFEGRGKAKRAKRPRRTAEQMKAEAEKMVKFIQSKKDKGTTRKEMTAKFGPYNSFPKFIFDTIKYKVMTRGSGPKTRYVSMVG